MIQINKILFILDPLPDETSVQFEIIKSICQELQDKFEISVFSSHVGKMSERQLISFGVKVYSAHNNIIYVRWLKNESMLWFFSWIKEAFLNKNSHDYKINMKNRFFDYVINLSNSTPVVADIWWNQGYPLFKTLDDIKENYSSALKLIYKILRPIIIQLDGRLNTQLVKRSKKIATNSRTLYDYYVRQSIKFDKVINSTKDFTNFFPTTHDPKRNYVLTYIGKETDIEPIIKLSKLGIKVVAFGGKVPAGLNISELQRNTEYLGYVSQNKLIDLYSNAKFTAFPFTNEPFGYVPIESMACGTPVLTYNKQGPADTVLDGITGWLVTNQDEFIAKAREIWKKDYNSLTFSTNCLTRARDFKIHNIVTSLLDLLEEANSTKNESRHLHSLETN